MLANAANDLGEMLRTADQIEDLVFGVAIRKRQFESLFAIYLLNMDGIQPEQWKRARRQGLEEARCDEPHLAKGRPGDYRIEYGLAHPVDDLRERNSRRRLYTPSLEVCRIRKVVVLYMHRHSPWRQRGPSLTDHDDTP